MFPFAAGIIYDDRDRLALIRRRGDVRGLGGCLEAGLDALEPFTLLFARLWLLSSAAVVLARAVDVLVWLLGARALVSAAARAFAGVATAAAAAGIGESALSCSLAPVFGVVASVTITAATSRALQGAFAAYVVALAVREGLVRPRGGGMCSQRAWGLIVAARIICVMAVCAALENIITALSIWYVFAGAAAAGVWAARAGVKAAEASAPSARAAFAAIQNARGSALMPPWVAAAAVRAGGLACVARDGAACAGGSALVALVAVLCALPAALADGAHGALDFADRLLDGNAAHIARRPALSRFIAVHC